MFGQSPFGSTPLGGYTQAAGGVTNYVDNLSSGTYTYTGISITDTKVIADSLSAGSYVITGQSVIDVLAKNDLLSSGAYALTGQSITDVYVGAPVVYADTLSKGAYTITGRTVTDLLAKNDSLSVGSYIITGQSITDTKTGIMTYADDLSAGAYAYTGYSIEDDLVPFPIITSQTKGGFSPLVKARKFKKADRDEIVEAVKIAIYGEPVAEAQIVEVVKEVAKVIKPRDFASEIAQYEYALEQTRQKIQAIVDAELDDEESLLLLL